MDFITALNNLQNNSATGYTKVDNLKIGYPYTITGCKHKETAYGSAITMNLEDEDGRSLWIFLPRRLSELFPQKNPFKKLKENKIEQVIYRGRDKSKYNTATFEFLNIEKENK